MRSLRSQTVEVPAHLALAVVSVAAGLTGVLVGYVGARRGRSRRSQGTAEARPERTADARLAAARRDYELDSGLLREEIHHLTELVAELTHRSSAHPDADADSEEGASSNRDTEREEDGMRFSTLEELSGKRKSNGESP